MDFTWRIVVHSIILMNYFSVPKREVAGPGGHGGIMTGFFNFKSEILPSGSF